ncbi:DnaA N-terminal domain-containing protein [Robertmurraya kyonggiensis]|uniref:DnaA N-terminal domain-containing protein n=1 Tax=Robertmurraya kyonggiensis TaxID=1037680 RepID=UPI00130DCA48|nr:DnaA N-terminal domain-containing protein [Robertmurraya kyonggiensis]
MENNKLWYEILESVKSEISPKAYNTWFKNTSLEIKENNSLVIYAANEFASDWVRKNYFTLI